MSQTSKIFLAVIITTIIVGSGIYTWQKLNQKSTEQPLQQGDQTSADSKAQQLTDKANLFSVEIPNDWKIVDNQGAMGVQLSRITAESPDWSYYSDDSYEGPFSPIYFQSGGSLSFHVTEGEEEPTHYGEGGGPKTGVIEEKIVIVSGIEGVYHIFKEPSTFEGQLIDLHINYEGNNYVIRLAYNPTNFDGEEFFDDLLDSFSFSGTAI